MSRFGKIAADALPYLPPPRAFREIPGVARYCERTPFHRVS